MPRTYGFLSTYPPTQCGLATFTSALVRSLNTPGPGDHAGVVRVVDHPVRSPAPEVVAHLYSRAAGPHRAAVTALNTFDLVVVQHDFSIFGGEDGDQLLALLACVRVPLVVVAHEIIACPTPHQRHVLEQVAHACEVVVAMTNVARGRLVASYGVDPAKIVVIPHGAPPRRPSDVVVAGQRPLILTWGLLGPGKGIEWAIDALQPLRRLHPRPAYLVAGPTHLRLPHGLGETYRLHLHQRARALGVSDLVRFAACHLDEDTLTRLIRRANVVLLPYDSGEQVSSGVLVEAVAAGKPVVATAFPHAVELLAGGAGVLVPHHDGAAIATALRELLTDADQARRMAAEASRLAPPLLWPAVAARYRTLFDEVLSRSALASR